jgi:hypothetical protein
MMANLTVEKKTQEFPIDKSFAVNSSGFPRFPR